MWANQQHLLQSVSQAFSPLIHSGHIRHECRSLPAIGSTPLPLHMVFSGTKLRGRSWGQYISPWSCDYLRVLPPTILKPFFSDASFRFQFGPETPSS